MLHPIFFIKDKKPAINFDVLKFKLLCPRVVKFSDKLYRMYFSKEKFKKENYNYTSIGSAISKDCKKWKVEKGYRLKILYGTKYYRILSPSIIKIKKSLYRMYFEARSFDKKSVIKSAISHDGLMWKEEPGIRIGESKKFSYGTPYCFRKDQGKYEIFFERRYKNKHDICHVNSSDGVFFDKKKIRLLIKQEKEWETYSITSPDISFSNNCYHMYYAAWGGKPIKGQIYYAFSYDKKNWKKSKIPVLIPDGVYDQNHCSEPSVIKIGDNWKIFYEGCDKNKFWRILCAQKSQ